MMTRLLAAAFGVVLSIGAAFAQSSPNLRTGQVPTAAQWNSYFSAKQDLLGYTPINKAGDVMTGPFTTVASTAVVSGFAVTPGTAPISPDNGDIWMTSAGLFYRAGGATYGPLTGGTSGSFAATPPIIVSFPSSVVTYAFDFTVANSWLATQTMRTVLAGTTNTYDIGVSETVSAFRTIYAGTSVVAPAATFATSLGAGTTTITSSSSAALSVGVNGATNPALVVDASTASSATGIKIKSAAAAGGIALSVVSSGSNENLTIDALGSGTISIGNTSTGAITLTRATTMSAALTYGGVTLSNSVTGTGSMALSASPTFTGTVTAAAGTFSGAVALQAGGSLAGTFSGTPTFSGVPVMSGLSVGTCVNGLALDSSNNIVKEVCATTAASITIGSTTVVSGTSTRILYNNAGTLGEYTITGSGTVVAMQTSPSFTTPSLGVATGSSIALGGCTIGAFQICTAGALSVTGGSSLGGPITYGGVTLSNSVTGTGSMVLSASPTFTGTVTNAAATFSGAVTISGALTYGGVALANAVTGTGNMVLSTSPSVTTLNIAGGGATITGSVTIPTGSLQANYPTAQITTHGVIGAAVSNAYYGIYGQAQGGNSYAGGFYDGAGNACTTIYGFTSWSCSSDRNIKDNIVYLTAAEALERLAVIGGVSYTMKKDASKKPHIGLIAQDVLLTFPELVSLIHPALGADGKPRPDEERHYGVEHVGLIGPMITAINDLNARVKYLEGQLSRFRQAANDNASVRETRWQRAAQ